MLTEAEKAYFQALDSLKLRDYQMALSNFEKAIPEFGTNSEFNLLYETTRLLVEVKKAITDPVSPVATEEKELNING